MPKYEMSVFIGRFQPVHNGHLSVIREALSISNRLLILIGSSMKAPSAKNPFSWIHRHEMILSCLTEDEKERVTIQPIRDHLYNDQAWVAQVNNQIESVFSKEIPLPHNWAKLPNDWAKFAKEHIVLIGNEKDESSYYLKLFPRYSFHAAKSMENHDSTILRNLIFKDVGQGFFSSMEQVVKYTPASVVNYLSKWIRANAALYTILCNETKIISDYKKSWECAPYPPTFVTCDAVVVQGGHVLLIKRKHAPGAGTWAMPGGFINQFETVQDACIRELKEETKIKVPEAVLFGSIKKEKRYDHPFRSERGRTITTAFLIELENETSLPKVKGSDDAEAAEWIPIHSLLKMEEQLYEDHFHIIRDMLGL